MQPNGKYMFYIWYTVYSTMIRLISINHISACFVWYILMSNILITWSHKDQTNGFVLALWCLTLLSKYFSYIQEVSFIGRGIGVPRENHRPLNRNGSMCNILDLSQIQWTLSKTPWINQLYVMSQFRKLLLV